MKHLHRKLLALVLVFAGGTPSALAQPAASPPKGPADIINGARRAQAGKELAQQAATAERAGKPMPRPVDPHAGVPGAPSLTGAGAGRQAAPLDPHAGVPGAPPLAGGAAAAQDPHAGVPGAPPVGAGNRAVPGRNPHAGMAGGAVGAAGGAAGPGGAGRPGMPMRPLETRAGPSPEVPTGAIRVRVTDGFGNPLPAVQVRLGIMGGDEQRSSKLGTADARGEHVFRELPVGKKQAYRINADRDGARFSTMPFRLPSDSGYDISLVVLPTTQERTAVVLYTGAVSVELKEERLKIAQQMRLINVTAEAYVFPEGGTRIPLPPGATSFQAEKSMGHQTVELEDDVVVVTGSLPPGQSTLLWGFELPLDGTEMDITLPVPWLTFAYRVISDGAPGMALTVDGFPEAIRHADEGRSYLVTEIQRKPGDAPFDQVALHLRGIPGPGPLRWIAAGLALLAVILGFWLSMRPRADTTAADRQALLARRQALLQRARDLEAEHARGEIGPQFHADSLEALTDELAVLLQQLHAAAGPKTPAT